MPEKCIIQLSFCQKLNSISSIKGQKHANQISYDEFLLKSQAYNKEKKFKTFSEMIAADGRANSLHYKTGFAIEPWILDIMKHNSLSQDHALKSIHFENHRFEIIESHIDDFEQHACVIHYYSQLYIWHYTIGNTMVLSRVNETKDIDGFIHTFALTMKPQLSIAKIKL